MIPKTKDNNQELNLQQYKQFRGAIGKLNWLQEGTRPDLSFDTLMMSMKTKHATIGDAKKMNKIIRKAKSEENVVKFGKLGEVSSLKIAAFCDASYRIMDDKVKRTEERVIFVTDGLDASTIYWKDQKPSQS